MHVVKNTLFLRAAEAAGKTGAGELAEGPTALIFGFDDPIAPIKTVVDYQRTARNTFVARKAFMDGTVYAGARLTELATMPSKEQLIAEIAGGFDSPITTFVVPAIRHHPGIQRSDRRPRRAARRRRVGQSREEEITNNGEI